MNSAPAELLHPLTYAALQPKLARRGALPGSRDRQKKTPAVRPTSEHCVKKNKPFFKEKAAFPDCIGFSGFVRRDRVGRLLFINSDCCLSSSLRPPSACAGDPGRLRISCFLHPAIARS